MTPYEEIQAQIDILDTRYVAAYGTEYEKWPVPALREYAVHLLVGYDAMAEAELCQRFCAEPDPSSARDESCAYWMAVLSASSAYTHEL